MQGQLFFDQAAVAADFMHRLKAGEHFPCPTCTRHAQLYRRLFHASMAAQLIRLYSLGGAHEYVHASRLILKGVSGAGDFSKAKYWGLIHSGINTDPHTKTSGQWMLSRDGVAFVLGNLRIPREVMIFDDKIYGVSEREITIREALGKRYNYNELMEARP